MSNTQLQTDVRQFFAEDGPLHAAVGSDYKKVREQQIELAEDMKRAFDMGAPLLAEGLTGVGKSFAYLVAALLSGKRIVVATSTLTLQDQLLSKDIPVIRVLCQRRLSEVLSGGLPVGDDGESLVDITRWVEVPSTRGDKAELA